MMENIKKWRWWVVLITVSPLWLIVATSTALAELLRGIAECVDYIGESRPPLWLEKFVNWGKK